MSQVQHATDGIDQGKPARGTVLVVDDSSSSRKLAGGLLREAQVAVEYAVNGVEALKRMAEKLPDLVLTDLQMPEMDGLELVTEIKSRHPLVPVILMTSQGSEQIAVQALRSGAASYVPKRTLAQDLASTVDSVLTASKQQRSRAKLIECMTKSEFGFVLHSDRSLVHPLVDYLLDTVTQTGLCNVNDRVRIGIALEESLINALFHGNLEVSSQLREEDDAAYNALVERRSHEPPYCHRRIFVDVKLSRSEGVFVVRDEGPGFDPTSLPDPTDPANLETVTGRGVLLMRTFMDEVLYNATGNEVTMIRRQKPQ